MFVTKKIKSSFLLALSLLSLGARGEAAEEFEPAGGKLNYVHLGAGMLNGIQEEEISSCIGLGRRYCSGSSAVDISLNWSINSSESYHYSLPKITYLFYGMPQSKTSLFYGGGLSWGGVFDRSLDTRFNGLMAEASLGIEFQRDQAMRPMIQLDISQPCIAIDKRSDLTKPSLKLAFGIGF